MSRLACIFVVTLFTLMPTLPSPAFAQQDSSGGLKLADALGAGFKKVRTTRYRGNLKPGARGIVQQSFLRINSENSSIQIAFVLDATDSMASDLDSLRSTLNSVIDGIRGQVTSVDSASVLVEVAIVVYRDLFSEDSVTGEQTLRPSPVVTYPPSGGFKIFDDASEQAELKAFLDSVKTEVGIPLFPEQVDRGLKEAINLSWHRDPAVTKVIFLAGDAPPFAEELRDWKSEHYNGHFGFWKDFRKYYPDLPTLRGYRTSELVDDAKANGIAIHAVLCDTSDSYPAKTRLQFRPPALEFFTAVSTGTGGGLMDLADPGTVTRLVGISTGRVQSMVELKSFKFAELNAKRVPASKVESPRVAFLPLVPLKNLNLTDYVPDPGYTISSRVAREVRDRMHAGLTYNSDELRKAWEKIKDSVKSRDPHDLIPLLAAELQADFIVWGQFDAEASQATLNISAQDGTLLAETSVANVSPRSPGPVWENVQAAIAGAKNAPIDAQTRFVSLAKSVDAQTTFVSTDSEAQTLSDIEHAYDLLEQATEFPLGQDEGASEGDGVRLSRKANAILEAVREREPENPVVLMLLASCATNLDKPDARDALLQEAQEAATGLAADDLLRLEIEGDYQLYVTRDPQQAIDRYQKLLRAAPEMSKTALRANWMLAGIFLADWSIDPGKLYSATLPVDVTLASGGQLNAGSELSMQTCQDLTREHILSILANWPDSPEARFYKQYIDPPVQRPDHSDAESDSTVIARQIEFQILIPEKRPTAVATAIPKGLSLPGEDGDVSGLN